jgi:hypothetical protein
VVVQVIASHPDKPERFNGYRLRHIAEFYSMEAVRMNHYAALHPAESGLPSLRLSPLRLHDVIALPPDTLTNVVALLVALFEHRVPRPVCDLPELANRRWFCWVVHPGSGPAVLILHLLLSVSFLCLLFGTAYSVSCNGSIVSLREYTPHRTPAVCAQLLASALDTVLADRGLLTDVSKLSPLAISCLVHIVYVLVHDNYGSQATEAMLTIRRTVDGVVDGSGSDTTMAFPESSMRGNLSPLLREVRRWRPPVHSSCVLCRRARYSVVLFLGLLFSATPPLCTALLCALSVILVAFVSRCPSRRL